jgi:ankyrin repeat protein
LIQYVQDKFYYSSYIADLVVLFLEFTPTPILASDLVVDPGNGMTLLHLLALAVDPDEPEPEPEDSYRYNHNRKEPPPTTDTAKVSPLQLALLQIPTPLINVADKDDDTPLRYACATHQLQNIKALLVFGADPGIRNGFGLNALEVLAWT